MAAGPPEKMRLAGLIAISDPPRSDAAACWQKFQLGFDIDRLRTLTLVTLLFNGQAVFYVVRERRRLWSSWPSRIVIASSIVDLAIIPTMSLFGILMAPLPFSVVLGVFAASVALALVLDQVKVATFRWLRMV